MAICSQVLLLSCSTMTKQPGLICLVRFGLSFTQKGGLSNIGPLGWRHAALVALPAKPHVPAYLRSHRRSREVSCVNPDAFRATSDGRRTASSTTAGMITTTPTGPGAKCNSRCWSSSMCLVLKSRGSQKILGVLSRIWGPLEETQLRHVRELGSY